MDHILYGNESNEHVRIQLRDSEENEVIVNLILPPNCSLILRDNRPAKTTSVIDNLCWIE